MSARILVVEDETLVACDLARLLGRLGYEVAAVVDAGDAAIREAASGEIDIALMDITLGGALDGIRTAQALRDRWGTAVVFLTAHSDDATLARASAVVPHGYLLKPFSERDIRTTLEVVLAKVAFERRLASQEQWFTDTVDSLGEAVITTDRSNNITYLNPVAERLTGWTRELAVGRPMPEVLLRTALDDPQDPATRVLSRTGAPRLIEDTATTIVRPGGEVLGSVVVARDVTELRRAERRIAAAERSASVGLLGSGVAHQINSPLTSMMMQLDVAQDALRALDARAAAARATDPALSEDMRAEIVELTESLDGAMSAASRVVHIVAELRALGRVIGETDRHFHLDAVVERAVVLCDVAPTTEVRVQRGTTPVLAGDEDDVVAVVEILIANAVDAIARRGTPGVIELSTGIGDDGRPALRCSDDGIGIAAGDRSRVFDPFFTTKDVGETLGFGLAKAHRIITALDGEIVIAPRPGGGTIASLVFPAPR